MSQAQNAGFAFWERATLVQFAAQASAALQAICEIADNNNPASVMHDDLRQALEQIEVLALGVQAQTSDEVIELTDSRWYWVRYEGLDKTYEAPAMYRSDAKAFYSVEFSGIPTRQVLVLKEA